MAELKLGVCYYPEHWDRTLWQEDFKRMREIGLEYVRLAEFSWTLMEPRAGQYDFSWLDHALELAEQAKMKVILCTPTTTPPAWVIEKHPQIIPYGKDGNRREFGSRRHYTFSSPEYLQLSKEITHRLVSRYGEHPAVVAWQTDNEYGCHETTRSYGPEDLKAFRKFLAAKYGDIAALNSAWGNVFWNQLYDNFEQILLPNATVTEANPSHWLDFYRFASAQVLAFNRAQTQILRKEVSNVRITHNMMGFFNEFDHFALGEDLDVASWDNYPLGYLEDMYKVEEDKDAYHCVGHPDISAFFHDLYRSVGKGHLWVMEQQPGPVNWAQHNPNPPDGLVRFWTWQAFSHGSELVSYFRWRQVPYGQEQMHAALLLPNSEPAQAYAEVQQIAAEKKLLPQVEPEPARVGLLFDYEGQWVTELQRHSAHYDYMTEVLRWYGAVRSYGLNVDVLSPDASLDAYDLILAPCLPILSSKLLKNAKKSGGWFLWGARCGSKTQDFHIPPELPPGKLQELIPLQVQQVSTLRGRLGESGPGSDSASSDAGTDSSAADSSAANSSGSAGSAAADTCLTGTGVFGPWRGGIWHESVRTDLTPLAQAHDGSGILYGHDKHHYLSICLDVPSLHKLIGHLLQQAAIATTPLPAGVRVCRTQQADFFFNFSQTDYELPAGSDNIFAPGTQTIKRGEYAALKKKK